MSTGLGRATGSGQAADAEVGQNRSSWPGSRLYSSRRKMMVLLPKEEAAEFLAKPDIVLFLYVTASSVGVTVTVDREENLPEGHG